MIPRLGAQSVGGDSGKASIVAQAFVPLFGSAAPSARTTSASSSTMGLADFFRRVASSAP